MWQNVAVPFGIQQSLDNIFGAIILGGINKDTEDGKKLFESKIRISKDCRAKFIADFPFNVFHDTYAIFYEIIVTLNAKIFSVEQLEAIVNNNRDLILDSPYIDKGKYAKTASGNIASDDDIVAAITTDLIESTQRLSYTLVTEDEYVSASVTYIDWYRNTFAEFTAQQMTMIMSDQGLDVKLPGKRSRHYHGYDDMTEYYNQNQKIIKSLSADDKIKTTIIDEAWYEEDEAGESRDDKNALFSIGLQEMDATIGELRRGNMLGILGPPKGGKTRFTAFLVNKALSLGLNVAVWPLEGTKEEWMAMLVACHMASESYKQVKANKREDMIRLSSKDILQRKYTLSKTMREEVRAAKMSIASNPNRGRLSFIEGTAYVEDMFDIMQSHYDTDNQFDVIVIDQLVNVMSRKGKGKVERISEAYMMTKNFIANKLKRPALGLMPAQLKQEVVDYLRKNPEADIDVTAGGESSETIRTPDESIGLFSSKEERDNNIMKFYSVASRHNGSFQNFQGRCYLECCFFLSENDEPNS